LLALLVTLSLTAACAKTVTVTVPSATTEVASTTPPTPSPHVTTVKVTGIPPTANSVTIVDGGGESQREGVALPYIVTLSDDPLIVRVTAQAGGAPTATITCEVDQLRRDVTSTASGAYAVVTC